MTLLKEYSEEAAAYIDKGLLKNYGIHSEVAGDAMSEVFPAPGAGTGAFGLYVADDDAAKARDILAHRG